MQSFCKNGSKQEVYLEILTDGSYIDQDIPGSGPRSSSPRSTRSRASSAPATASSPVGMGFEYLDGSPAGRVELPSGEVTLLELLQHARGRQGGRGAGQGQAHHALGQARQVRPWSSDPATCGSPSTRASVIRSSSTCWATNGHTAPASPPSTSGVRRNSSTAPTRVTCSADSRGQGASVPHQEQNMVSY